MLLSPPEAGPAYLEGPPPGHTGGFNEPTCQACHSGEPLNEAGGDLALSGVPASYNPGNSYLLTITLRRGLLQRAGFQLSARYADGENAGHQAGDLAPVDGRVRVIAAGEPPILYAEHSVTGSEVSLRDTALWIVEWTAPAERTGAIVFHAAANASNDDNSEFGDFVYNGSWRSVAWAP